MPKNNVTDPITDQEIAFARLILSGTMTDRRAAEAVGIDPGSAAYTKAKPRVRAYMREHRAAVQQQLVLQEAEGLHRLNLDRDQVLARLWQLANLSPELTRGSIAGQVKALAIIVAMQNFIPDRLAVPTEKNPTPPPANPQIYVSAWRRAQQATTTAPQPDPAPVLQDVLQDDAPSVPEPEVVPASGEGPLPDPAPGHSTFATHLPPSPPQPPAPFVPVLTHVPDARAPFSVNRNPFGRRR